MTEWITAAIGAVGMLLAAYMYHEAHLDRVLYHEFSYEEYPKGMEPISLFFISDIHRRLISDSIISEVKDKAQAVIIGGDLAEKGVPVSRIEQNLTRLSKIGPVFFIWGNNDSEVGVQTLENLFGLYGITVLNGQTYELEANSGSVTLIGIDDLTRNPKPFRGLEDKAKSAPFSILLSHQPAIMKQLPEDSGLSLVLSGHTHGGQIRLFGIGPYQKGSIRKHGKTIQLVSNGYGTSLLPLRLGAKPETHLITLSGQSCQNGNLS
ncbi:MAG TPA: metallophosphoesterase [Bacillaceae bacterium]